MLTRYIIDVIILICDINSPDKIILFRYDPFKENHCYQVNIRRFEFVGESVDPVAFYKFNEKLKWTFSKCTVTIGMHTMFPSFINVTKTDDLNVNIQGFEGNILKFLSETLNFTIDFKNDNNSSHVEVVHNMVIIFFYLF